MLSQPLPPGVSVGRSFRPRQSPSPPSGCDRGCGRGCPCPCRRPATAWRCPEPRPGRCSDTCRGGLVSTPTSPSTSRTASRSPHSAGEAGPQVAVLLTELLHAGEGLIVLRDGTLMRTTRAGEVALQPGDGPLQLNDALPGIAGAPDGAGQAQRGRQRGGPGRRACVPPPMPRHGAGPVPARPYRPWVPWP